MGSRWRNSRARSRPAELRPSSTPLSAARPPTWRCTPSCSRDASTIARRGDVQLPPQNRAAVSDALRKQVASLEWYHTLDLAHGVVTPGWLDHRSILDRIPLPSSLA